MSSRPNLAGENQLAERPRGSARATSIRRLHALLGVISALNLLLLISTGLLLQHLNTLHLDEQMISRTLLPQAYRPQDGAEVRADIVVTDLHSGRILGPVGKAILDVITIAWLISLLTGLVMYAARTNGKRRNGFRNGAEYKTPVPSPQSSLTNTGNENRGSSSKAQAFSESRDGRDV